MPDFTDKLKPAEPSGPSTLARERSQSSIPVEQLAQHLFAGDGFLERQSRVLKELQKEKLLSKAKQQNLARPDSYKLGLARAKLLRRMADRLGWDYEDHKMAEYLVDDFSPYVLQTTMFVTTVREQASDEQRAYWMPLIEQWKIIGAYGQSELGHGSNVRGLECEARYDPETKEFIIHSPTLTASKWWNGSLGRTATHSIVVAQLMLPKSKGSKEYVSHGPKPFIIQVRDSKTHKPLPGIAVGDIGAKYGYVAMDNAYMLFDNHRVPHSAFLSRYFQVNPDTGEYTSNAQNPAVVYGSLTNMRVTIVMHARLVLARAVTVAVRYLSVRRQFRDRDDDSGTGPEMAVLDYPTVQIRVLPLLATSYALHYSGRAMVEQYEATRTSIEKGDFSALSGLHAASSGMKSICTTYAADGIETCRRALGGHGFGGGSGLIQLNNDYLSKPTVEGDNWMITQQTASYLIKKMTELVESSSPPTKGPADLVTDLLTAYLKAKGSNKLNENNSFKVLDSDAAIVDAFERRAAHLTHQAYTARTVKKSPWNSLLIQLHSLSNAFCQSILVRNFYNVLYPSSSSSSSSKVPPGAHGALLTSFRLFAFYTMNANARDFSQSAAVSNTDLDVIPDRILSLMAELRKDAVRLVDAWSIPDYLLDSALGRYDGKVYEDLFERAHKLNPLNKETFNPYYWQEEIIMGEPDSGKAILAKI